MQWEEQEEETILLPVQEGKVSCTIFSQRTTFSSLSSVAMLNACSIVDTNITPSPCSPVLADSMSACTILSTWLSESTISNLTQGSRSNATGWPLPCK